MELLAYVVAFWKRRILTHTKNPWRNISRANFPGTGLRISLCVLVLLQKLAILVVVCGNSVRTVLFGQRKRKDTSQTLSSPSLSASNPPAFLFYLYSTKV